MLLDHGRPHVYPLLLNVKICTFRGLGAFKVSFWVVLGVFAPSENPQYVLLYDIQLQSTTSEAIQEIMLISL